MQFFNITAKLKVTWQKLLRLLRPAKPLPDEPPQLTEPPPAARPANPMVDLLAAGLTPPVDMPLLPPTTPPAPADALPDDSEPKPKLNRKARRARKKIDNQQRRHFEKQRMKFDKWVTPQGTPPTPGHRAPSTAPENETDEAADEPEIGSGVWDDDRCIVDVHYSDRKTDVLYEPEEFLGHFNFRDSILDQIERTFFYVDRMAKHDVDSYKFYQHVGATLVPYVSVPDIREPDFDGPYDKERAELTPWFKTTRPTFGCIAYGSYPEAERIEKDELQKTRLHMWIPRFLYFVKYERGMIPWEMQPINRPGDHYKLSIWWDKDEKRYKHGRPSEIGFFVSTAGEITVLKSIATKLLPVHSKRDGTFHIPQREYHIPCAYEEWARKHGVNAKLFLSNLFCDVTKHCEHAASAMCRVSVEKNGKYLQFNIQPHRLPYFFKDRDYRLTENGKRERIFHPVKAHMRNGKPVPLSFRGTRHFTWGDNDNKYNVTISIPGKHHHVWEELDIGLLDGRRVKKDGDIITSGEIGRRIRAEMQTGKYDFGKPDELDQT